MKVRQATYGRLGGRRSGEAAGLYPKVPETRSDLQGQAAGGRNGWLRSRLLPVITRYWRLLSGPSWAFRFVGPRERGSESGRGI